MKPVNKRSNGIIGRTTYPASGDKANFLAGDGRTGDCRGLTNVLMVTTTVGVVNWVHGNTTSAGPTG